MENMKVQVLVDPTARQDDIILKKAQMSDADLPCLYPIDYQKLVWLN